MTHFTLQQVIEVELQHLLGVCPTSAPRLARIRGVLKFAQRC